MAHEYRIKYSKIRRNGKVYTISKHSDGIQTSVDIYEGDIVDILANAGSLPDTFLSKWIGQVYTARGEAVTARTIENDDKRLNGVGTTKAKISKTDGYPIIKTKSGLIAELRNWVIDNA